MTILHMPVGIPGCGKSGFAHTGTAMVISTDMLREQLTGDAKVQTSNDEVFKRFYELVDFHLDQGYDVYADATNLEAYSRLRLREIADQYKSVKTHLILFRNVEQAIVRNSARDRVVPADAMVRMIEKYERALMEIPEEPYDYVTEVSAVR
jgi:predicted kinase